MKFYEEFDCYKRSVDVIGQLLSDLKMIEEDYASLKAKLNNETMELTINLAYGAESEIEEKRKIHFEKSKKSASRCCDLLENLYSKKQISFKKKTHFQRIFDQIVFLISKLK
ncbi:MAG: hypothetical protein ABIA04_10925 [Pseudomonadota bacterium]